MTGNTVINGMRPPLLSIMAASGALYSHASGSILPSRARMATLMLRTSGHLGNVGSGRRSWDASSAEVAAQLASMACATANG